MNYLLEQYSRDWAIKKAAGTDIMGEALILLMCAVFPRIGVILREGAATGSTRSRHGRSIRGCSTLSEEPRASSPLAPLAHRRIFPTHSVRHRWAGGEVRG